MFRLFRRKGKEKALTALSPFQHTREINRSIAEMLQVIRRVLADGVVTEEEAGDLSAWTKGHPEVVEAWPGKVLAHRLEKIFLDGRVDERERMDLERLLRALAAGDWGVRGSGAGRDGVPLTEPPPVLVFPEQEFVLTGEFAYGPREACQEAVRTLGGRVGARVSADTDVLVIGTFGASEWGASPEAEEIETALELRRQGHEVSIVSEGYWATYLPRA